MVLCWVGSVPNLRLPFPPCLALGSRDTDRSEPNWIGALLPTNNTGEISAFYHSLKWIRVSDGISSKPVRRRLSLITDSEYCVRLFGDNSIKARRNKVLIQHVRRLLQEVRAHHDIAIFWIKAHTGGSSPEELGNEAADQWAAPGRSGFSSAVARPPVWTRRSRRPRSSSSSDPLRRSCREPRVRLRDPRLLTVTRYLSPPNRAAVCLLPVMTRYLSPPHRAAVLHLATTCRDRSRVPPVPPEAFGDVVGD